MHIHELICIEFLSLLQIQVPAGCSHLFVSTTPILCRVGHVLDLGGGSPYISVIVHTYLNEASVQ